jgi:hypothetical protein
LLVAVTLWNACALHQTQTLSHILSILSFSLTQAKRNYQLLNLAPCNRFFHKLKGFIPLHIHHLLRKVKNKPLYIPIESNLVKKVSKKHSKDIFNFFEFGFPAVRSVIHIHALRISVVVSDRLTKKNLSILILIV